MTFAIHQGNCLEVMPRLVEAAGDPIAHAIVSDPPYGLEFMGKGWDGQVPGVPFWAAALKCVPPGGHLLAFGGSRTWHRLAAAIEDAGWEIRDSLMWLYGSGFPKSLDIGKAIDRATVRDRETGELVFRGSRADVLKVTAFLRDARDRAGLSNREIDAHFGFVGMAGHWTTQESQPAVPRWDQWLRLKALLNFGDAMDAEAWRLDGRKGKPGEAYQEREVIGTGVSGIGQAFGDGEWARGGSEEYAITAPATAAAEEWDGWGTCLKPAWEPIILARRPIKGTIAANVLEHRTGAINVDGCRVGTEEVTTSGQRKGTGNAYGWAETVTPEGFQGQTHRGRWPANLILDGWQEQVLYLRDDVSSDVASLIRDYFRGYNRVPAMRSAVSGVPIPTKPDEVLRPDVLFGGPVRAGEREPASDVRPEASAGIVGGDDGEGAGQCKTRLGKSALEGWPGDDRPGICDDSDGGTFLGGAGAVRGDGGEQTNLHPGASSGDGSNAGAPSVVYGGGASPERDQTRQPTGESGNTQYGNPPEGAHGSLTGAAIVTTRERAFAVLACDVPSGWRSYFRDSGIVVPSPDSAAALLDAQSGEIPFHFTNGVRNGINSGAENRPAGSPILSYGDTGGASRFFYTAKASRSERDAGLESYPLVDTQKLNEGGIKARIEAAGKGKGRNVHPTVKPLSLMRWLVRLITPHHGTVLDPFMGSGSTGCAAILEDKRFIGIDLSPEYCALSRARMDRWGEQLSLFGPPALGEEGDG